MRGILSYPFSLKKRCELQVKKMRLPKEYLFSPMFVSPHPSKEAQLNQTSLHLRPLCLGEKFEGRARVTEIESP